MRKWSKVGFNYYPAVEATFYEFPKTGVFKIFAEKGPIGIQIGLENICDKFDFDYKIYDLGTKEIEERIKNTWNSPMYKNSGKNLGIIYNGVKGTGKTVGAKLLCNYFITEMPVLVISQFFDGISDFVQSIDFPCIVFIDEAEKIFNDSDSDCSLELLRMIDGVYSASRKIFILTTNTLSLNDNLIDRPSRIRYVKEFGNVTQVAIEEIIEDKLLDKSKKPELLSEIEKLTFSTIDIIENLIFEFNIHGNVIEGDTFNIPRKTNRIPFLKIDLSTYVGGGANSFVEFGDVIELSKEFTASIKKQILTVGSDISMDKIFPDNVNNLGDISLSEYIKEYFLEKTGLDKNTYLYNNIVGVTFIETWSPELFKGLVLDNGDEILDLDSNCFKIQHYYGDELYYGILL